jgi:hypothetical protein
MGRPLNKKYFGNKNSPFTDFQGSTTPDSGIGGRVASVTLGDLGAYTTRPTVTFSASTLVGGVTATGTVTSEALSAVATAAGTGYVVGDLLTVTTAGGSAIFRVATVDTGGEVLTVDFDTGASRGSFEALPSGAQATTDNSVAGDGATLTITFRAKAVVITNAGQGYVTAADAAPTFTQSVTGTTVLSTVSNSRAIKAFAYLTGGSRLSADIIKQDNDRAYKVENATGVGIVQLVDSEANAAGEMDITAYDSDANEYWVKKLTGRKAVITRKSSEAGQFVSGTSVPWTFDSAVEDYSVKIDNA